MGQSTQTASRPRAVAAVHVGFQCIEDLLPQVAFKVLRAQLGGKTGVLSASRAGASPHCACGGVQPIDKQVAPARQTAIHDGAAQAADRGTHAHECASGGGGNPVSCDVRTPCPLPTHIETTRHAANCRRPKTLTERLQWMEDNLPGFREELAQVNATQQKSTFARA